MSNKIIRLLTAATTYYRVRRAGKLWRVELVTPCPGAKPIVTKLVASDNPEIAVDYARGMAASAQRPLRLPKNLRPKKEDDT